MLAATFPPRPRDHEVRTSPGHAGVTAELGQQQTCLDVSQVKNSLHLPRITHRTSSSWAINFRECTERQKWTELNRNLSAVQLYVARTAQIKRNGV